MVGEVQWKRCLSQSLHFTKFSETIYILSIIEYATGKKGVFKIPVLETKMSSNLKVDPF